MKKKESKRENEGKRNQKKNKGCTTDRERQRDTAHLCHLIHGKVEMVE